MDFKNRRKSDNIRHRGRGSVGARIGGGGIILGLIVFLLTGNPMTALYTGLNVGGGQQVTETPVQMTREEQDLYDYSAVALADTEDVWNELLPQYGFQYREPQLNIFDETVQSGCGIAQSGMGPFYCSADESIYMDLDFYETLVRDFGTEDREFIISYVISHEVGHHVQQVTGVLGDVHQARRRASTTQANELTTRLELQADYLAGVVARHQYDDGYVIMDDIEAAISAAWAIGDDTIQMNQRGYVTPESFTHGTSEQRTRWFKKGFNAGDLSEWDTFSEPDVRNL